jgi:translation initiation factor 3 subunit E
LASNWQVALSDFNNLRQEIESRTFPTNYHLLQHRKNLLSWSLFIFFKTNELDMMIDFFLQPAYFNTIQTSFPEMLKYLTAVVIIQRYSSHDLLKTLSLNVQQGAIIDFYQSLFSFPSAEKLSAAVAEISKDVFMKSHADIFSKQAKALLLESLSKLHVSLKLSDLLKQLGLTNAQDIVALLPSVTIDSKMDSLIFSKSTLSCLSEKCNQVELKVKALISSLEQESN